MYPLAANKSHPFRWLYRISRFFCLADSNDTHSKDSQPQCTLEWTPPYSQRKYCRFNCRSLNTSRFQSPIRSYRPRHDRVNIRINCESRIPLQPFNAFSEEWRQKSISWRLSYCADITSGCHLCALMEKLLRIALFWK